ncbi:MAG: RNA methyltransferase [Pseudomonadota bacterium]
MSVPPDPGINALLARVRVVLVGTTHPGNIGAAARAMRVMGLQQLHLVSPRTFPSAEATARAAGADGILSRAKVHQDLDNALASSVVVYGTTARPRHITWPTLTPRQAATEIIERASSGDIALVFGREKTGLSNTELDRCQKGISIATDPDYRSLNLAQAVQILAYELRLAALETIAVDKLQADRTEELASHEEVENLIKHLIETMTLTGYHDPEKPKLLSRRIQRLLFRAELRHSETQFLRGFLTSVTNNKKN